MKITVEIRYKNNSAHKNEPVSENAAAAIMTRIGESITKGYCGGGHDYSSRHSHGAENCSAEYYYSWKRDNGAE